MGKNPRYALYLAGNDREYLLEITHNPSLEIDFWYRRRDYRRLVLLTPFLSLAKAYELWEKTTTTAERRGSPISGGQELQRLLRKKEKQVSHLGYCSGESFFPRANYYLPLQETSQINELFEGRKLLLSEVRRLLAKERIIPPGNIEDLLQLMYLQGNLERLPAVKLDRQGTGGVCLRCGSRQIVPENCPRCGERCGRCETCQEMGKASACEPLYFFHPGSSKEYCRQKIVVRLPFTLTGPQRSAAAGLLEFLKEPAGEALVWAACGAGKTEVVFPAIAKMLSEGKRVLYTAPRRDLVREMLTRFQKAFPGISLAAAYGGSAQNYQQVQLQLATTHQTLRYYKQFDLVVLDEVDAFPYQGSSFLYQAVQGSRKPGGRIIYLTATPGSDLQKKAADNRLKLISIPARHHGHPLPEPEFVITKGSKLQRDKLPAEVVRKVYESIEGGLCQVMFFVPTVLSAQETAEKLLLELSAAPYGLPREWVQFSHSRDPRREEKCLAFKKGEFPLLVCTTILERGINVPRVNVVVFQADREEIFDAAALVQMAGRAGRYEEYPLGKVWFAAERVTTAMAEAKSQIKRLNEMAYNQGFLKFNSSYQRI